MANTGEAFLDAIAGLSGKTAFEVWESGNNWSEIIKNAESVLGKQSKWTVLADEAGNAFQIVGKNGKYINIGSAAGAAEEYVAGNQLVTDVVLEESGALTAYTGDIVAAGGEVTKKGLALGAGTGAKFLTGALSAFGAVATGINWYRDNPEFWTDVSSKLLPFGFADPTEKSWGEIFQEALIPSAVDSDGNTYVQAALVEAFYKEMYNNNAFTVRETAISNEDVVPEQYRGLSIPITKNKAYRFSNQPYAGKTYYNIEEYISFPEETNTTVVTFRRNRDSEEGFFGYLNFGVSERKDLSFAYIGGVDSFKNFPQEAYASKIFDLTYEELQLNPAFRSSKVYNEYTVGDKTFYAYTNEGLTNTVYGGTFVPSIESAPLFPYEIEFDEKWYAYIALFGVIATKGLLDNVNFPSATPTAPTLPEAYPDWYKNAVTTVNPKWKPGEPESDDNPKYVTWLPFKFPDDDVPDGETQPDETPEDTQSGKPSPDSPVKPSTDIAYKDGVLPDPTPNPETEPSTGTTPDIPNPPSGDVPTPDIPIIAGGTSNALWKIYNPSQEVLRQFGAWLWSSDPVKMIKELFSNNPADGIIRRLLAVLATLLLVMSIVELLVIMYHNNMFR